PEKPPNPRRLVGLRLQCCEYRHGSIREELKLDMSGLLLPQKRPASALRSIALPLVLALRDEIGLLPFDDPGNLAMKEVPLSEIKDDLSRFLREAETQEIVITRHGKPAGVLIGFESEEDWFEYRLEHDPRFLRRIEQARSSLRAGRGIRL